MRRASSLVPCVLVALLLGVGRASADTPPGDGPEPPAATGAELAEPAAQPVDAEAIHVFPGTFRFPSVPGFVRLGAYVETYGQWNPRNPWNGIDAYRAFDSRTDTFSLTNACLSVDFDLAHVVGRVALQIGLGPSTYYESEPTHPAWGGVAASGPEVWKYLQEAYAGYDFEGAHAPTVEAGIFLSPIGPESMSARANWNFSRSNLFFGLPFYHTGVRVSVPLVRDTKATFYVVNGWNSVVDNNLAKTLIGQISGMRGALAGSLLYVGGIERNQGDPAGMPWRNVVDAYATYHRTGSRFHLIAQANGGLEHNDFGRSYWAATAVAARFDLHAKVYVALRGDFFYEHRAQNSQGEASAIFWPSKYVSEGTLTLAYEPVQYVSFRLEYRHDQAAGPTYFDHTQVLDASGNPVLTSKAQDTLALALLAGF